MGLEDQRVYDGVNDLMGPVTGADRAEQRRRWNQIMSRFPPYDSEVREIRTPAAPAALKEDLKRPLVLAIRRFLPYRWDIKAAVIEAEQNGVDVQDASRYFEVFFASLEDVIADQKAPEDILQMPKLVHIYLRKLKSHCSTDKLKSSLNDARQAFLNLRTAHTKYLNRKS